MDPYPYVREATKNGESLLSLCCGIGLELYGLATQDVTAVDLAPQYLAEVHQRCPQAKLIVEDVYTYTKRQPDNSVDVISIIDGIEHLPRRTGARLIPQMKRVARKKILLFTPEGYLKNEPHNAWGIEGADHLQRHLSGWTVEDLEQRGFRLLNRVGSISQHNEPYHALMFEWVKA